MRRRLLTIGCLALVIGMGAPDDSALAKERWPQPALGPSVSGAPEVLITFDDGPHQTVTPRILDILKKHGIQTIFFTAGWRLSEGHKGFKKRRAIMERVLNEGHIVGNHTVNHARLCSGPRNRAIREIDDNQRLLMELSHTPVRYFRTPYGSRCKRLEKMLSERKMSHLHWDFDAREYLEHDVDRTVGYMTRQLRKLEGRAVILLHDTQPTSAKALPRILAWIQRENEQRRKKGRLEIRILSPGDLAREALAPGLLLFLDKSRDQAAQVLPAAAERLLLPLTGWSASHEPESKPARKTAGL